MNNILLLALFFGAAFPVAAQTAGKSPLPPDQLKLRTELESDKSVITITCGLYEEIDPKQRDAAQYVKLQREASRARLLLYQASLKKNKTVKVKMPCATDEGTTVNDYLLVENGKARFVGDFSRDYYGGSRIIVYDCDRLVVGNYVPISKNGIGLKFEPLAPKDYENKIVILKCITGDNTAAIF